MWPYPDVFLIAETYCGLLRRKAWKSKYDRNRLSSFRYALLGSITTRYCIVKSYVILHLVKVNAVIIDRGFAAMA